MLVLAAPFILLVTTAAGAVWEQERLTDDGIAIYSRTSAGTTVREVKAQMAIAAPAKTVFEAARDPATFKSTTKKYVEKNLFYYVSDPNIWYNYQRLNLPVIAKRDYCLRYEKVTNPEKGVYAITWRTSSRYGPPPLADVVRISKMEGSFEVTFDKLKKRSILRYTLLVDPGGSIPSWLINFANRRSLPNILRQVKEASLKRVREGK